MVCDMNCFECKYEDCINDELYEEDYRQSEEISRLAGAKMPYGGSFKKKVYYRAYYETNKDKIKAYNKRYHEANRDRLNKYRKAYYEAHAEEARAYSRKYYQENKKKILDCYKVLRKSKRGTADEARKTTDKKTETAFEKL